jgi:hypothetical protein
MTSGSTGRTVSCYRLVLIIYSTVGSLDLKAQVTF